MANCKNKRVRVIRLLEYEQELCFTCKDNKELPLCILEVCPKYQRWATLGGGKDETLTAEELKARIAFVLMQEGVKNDKCDNIANAVYNSFFNKFSAREKNGVCQNIFRRRKNA